MKKVSHMIEVNHISKDFVAPKKYPGLRGAVKGLFSAEKVIKTAVDDISFSIDTGEISGLFLVKGHNCGGICR